MEDKNILLEKLYNNLQINSDSKNISSHWKEYNKISLINKFDNQYVMHSYGIAQFSKKTFSNFIKQLPKKLYIYYAIKKYLKNKLILNKIKLLCKKQNILVEFDQIRQGIVLDIITKNIKIDFKKYICIIGDGHGFLGGLIKLMYPKSKIIFINISKNLFFDAFYVLNVFKNAKAQIVDFNNLDHLAENDFIFIDADNYELISKLSISVFINFASMQEMNKETISQYFYFMRKNISKPYFYCCNRKSKVLHDKSIINFYSYPWLKEDQMIIDESCKWHKYYPTSLPLFFKRYNGEVVHRLIKFS